MTTNGPVDANRAQDVGRSHHRRPTPAPEAKLISATYAALRAELSDCLAELRPPLIDPAAPVVFGSPPPKGRPSLADRDRLVALIARLLGILGAEVEAPEAAGRTDPAQTTRPRPRRGRLDMG